MRIREKKFILERNIGYLNFNYQRRSAEKYDEIEIDNYYHLKIAIDKFSKLKFIDREVEQLDEMGFFRRSISESGEIVRMKSDEFNNLSDIVRVIKLKAEAVYTAISEYLPPQDPNSVSIKLPNYREFSEVITFVKDIENILKQTLIDDFKGPIRFQSFDTGSNWIEIILDNKDAVVFLGGLIACSAKFLEERYITWIQTRQNVKKVNLEQKILETVLEGINQTLRQEAQSHASALMKDFNISETHNEYHTNLSHSILKLTELMSKGTEIHPVLNAPHETQQTFPNPSEINSIVGNVVKLLTDGSSNNNSLEDNKE